VTSMCAQCGREGTREFTTVGGFWDHAMFPEDNEPVWVPFITVCANRDACRKRWPRETEDALDARLA
jgi:hypothetical protein